MLEIFELFCFKLFVSFLVLLSILFLQILCQLSVRITAVCIEYILFKRTQILVFCFSFLTSYLEFGLNVCCIAKEREAS